MALIMKAFGGLVFLLLVMAVALRFAAGTVRYREGWIYLAVFGGGALLITVFLMRKDPALLERRVAAGPIAEQRPRQKIIQALASLSFLGIIVVPALDRRFGWSHVPAALVVAGDLLVAAGFGVVFLVFRANTYASALIEVGAGQTLIDTGPYAHVRHPMYAGAAVLLAGTPPALGSFVGLLCLAPFVVVIVLRLLDEEALLARELEGYEAYRRKVRYRLIPGVW